MIDIQQEVGAWLSSSEALAWVGKTAKTLEEDGMPAVEALSTAIVRAAVWKAVELWEEHQ